MKFFLLSISGLSNGNHATPTIKLSELEDSYEGKNLKGGGKIGSENTGRAELWEGGAGWRELRVPDG